MWDGIWEWPGNEAVNELVNIDWHSCSCVPLEGVHDRERDACPGVCARWVVPEGKLTLATNSFLSIFCFLTSHHIHCNSIPPTLTTHHPHLSPSHPPPSPTTLDHSLPPHTLTPLLTHHPHRNGRIEMTMTSLSLNVSYCFSETSSTSRLTHRRKRWHSHVPRLPRSGMQTIQLCRRGEPGIFCHVKSVQGGTETLIVCGHTRRLRIGKWAWVVNNLLHVSSCRGPNTIHTKQWTHSWLNNKMLPFCSKTLVLFSLRHPHVRKYTMLWSYLAYVIPMWENTPCSPHIYINIFPFWRGEAWEWGEQNHISSKIWWWVFVQEWWHFYLLFIAHGRWCQHPWPSHLVCCYGNTLYKHSVFFLLFDKWSPRPKWKERAIES